MNYNDDDSILHDENSGLRPPQLPNFQQFIPNQIPGFPGGPNPGGPNPGGPNPGSNLNVGPPPNFTPSKNAPGVKNLNQPPGPSKGKGPQTKAVSPGSISFCLFKFTYIWERGGRNYWTFLLNVDRQSISGLRWFRGNWVFFGLDLRRIDSFICYRSDSNTSDTNIDNDNLRKETLIQSKKEFKDNDVKNIYTRVLSSIEVPEEKDDFIVNYLGEVDGNDLTMQIPCKQRRTIRYRIVLEVKYPETLSKNIIEEINNFAIEASDEAVKHLENFRDSKKFLSPFEIFTTSTKNITKTVKTFSEEFTSKIKKLKLPREVSKEIEYTIIQEKIEEPWRIV